jgi:hypothetical protein
VALLTEAIGGLGSVLLPVAAGLLLEELTLGGLVRLLLAPWPGPGKRVNPNDNSSLLGRNRGEQKNLKGGGKCSH